MSIFKKNPNEINYVHGKKHITDVIKNTGNGDLLIWLNGEEDFNTYSTLIVAESEEAIFVKDGKIEEVFTEGRYHLKTNNYPFISRLVNSLSGGISTFNCKVYFVRKAVTMELFWGDTVQVIDKAIDSDGISANVYAQIAYKVRILDSKKFLTKLLGNNISFMKQDELKNYFRGEFSHIIGKNIREYFNTSEKEIIIQCQNYEEIKNKIKEPIANSLIEYGIQLVSLNIADIGVPESDPYMQIYMETRTQSVADMAKRIKEAKAAKAEQEILGINWAEQKSAEILKDLANNDGSIGIMAGVSGDNGIMSQLSQNIGSHIEHNLNEIICPNCKTPNKMEAKYCMECGMKLDNICKKCGKELQKDEKYCSQCGTKREE